MKDIAVLTAWDSFAHYNRFSALALLLFEYGLTIEDERELFWSKPLTFASALFVWNRYISIILMTYGAVVTGLTNPTDSTCWTWLCVEAWLGTTSAWSVGLILQLRMYALYDRSYTIAVTMVLAFLTQAAGLITVLAYATSHMSAKAHTVGYLGLCVAHGIPPHLYVFWVIALAFESVLCALALARGGRGVLTGKRLQDILFRDSLLYYLGVACVYSINLVLWVKWPRKSLDVMTPFAVALPAVMGSRLMINVRSAYYKPLRHSIDSPSDLSLHIPDSINDHAPAGGDNPECNGAYVQTSRGREASWGGRHPSLSASLSIEVAFPRSSDIDFATPTSSTAYIWGEPLDDDGRTIRTDKDSDIGSELA